MTIVGGEERAMRAREVLAESYRSGGMLASADGITAGNLTTHDTCVIRAMLTFAAEASGIGVLTDQQVIDMTPWASPSGQGQIMRFARQIGIIAASISSRDQRLADDVLYAASKPIEE